MYEEEQAGALEKHINDFRKIVRIHRFYLLRGLTDPCVACRLRTRCRVKR